MVSPGRTVTGLGAGGTQPLMDLNCTMYSPGVRLPTVSFSSCHTPLPIRHWAPSVGQMAPCVASSTKLNSTRSEPFWMYVAVTDVSTPLESTTVWLDGAVQPSMDLKRMVWAPSVSPS